MSIALQRKAAAPHSKSALGSFLSSPYALGLTVPHKTVAEAH